MIYHFNVHDGTDYPDALGTECATLQDARVEAVRRIGRLLAEEAARFWTGDEWTMTVTDANGLILFTLTFMAANSAAILASPKDRWSTRCSADDVISLTT